MMYSIHHGVYISEPTEMATVTSTHNIILKFNMTQGLEVINFTRSSLADAAHSAPKNHPFTKNFIDQLQTLSRTISEKERDLAAYLQTDRTTKHNRQKRTPFAGRVLGAIFGLPTNDELEGLITQINKHSHAEQQVINKVVSTLTNK